MSQPLKTFIIYAREDAAFKNELLRQLAPFAQQGLLEKWDDSHILPGEEWEKSIKKALEASQIVLMLVSANSLFSEFIQREELRKALEQKREGITRVIPILVQDCLYDMAEGIGDLQMLPLHPVSRSLVPVDDLVTWGSRASAWAAALRQLREVVTDVHARVAAEEAAAERLAADLAAEAQRAEEAAHAEREKNQRATRQAENIRLKDEAAWEVATEENTLHAYETYLEDGFTLHKTEAEQRVKTLQAAVQKQKAAERAAREAAETKAREEAARLAAEAQRAKEAATKVEAERKAHEEAARKKVEAEKAAKADPFQDLMLPIKGGSFDMGSNDYASEQPIHKVTVSDFLLCKYPVTQAQWKQIMGKNPSHFAGDDNLPVEKVSWNDVQEFIKTLNALTGGQKKYRLPTEAEWEFAARGGTLSKNFKFSGSNDLKEVGWYNENAGSKTHPVGQKKSNELGLYDMSGNVWEWCEDTWHPDYKGAPNDGSAWTKGGSPGRVLRGGSWGSNDNYCRSADRGNIEPDSRSGNIGFRLAQD